MQAPPLFCHQNFFISPTSSGQGWGNKEPKQRFGTAAPRILMWDFLRSKKIAPPFRAWTIFFGVLKIRLSGKAPVKPRTLARGRALSADFYDKAGFLGSFGAFRVVRRTRQKKQEKEN